MAEERGYDVVVIGGGGSGLAAAIAAADQGAGVIVLEKNPVLGGTTALSVGVISATRTPNQTRMGIVDSPEAHYEDMELFSKIYTSRADNDALRRVLAENLPDTVQWLSSLGVEFFGPTEESPHRKPRMHNALPGARSYIYHLQRRAKSIGVQILTNARARRLLVSDGRVVGVEFDQPGGAGTVARAARGVILTTGDYSANPDMKRELISAAVADAAPVNPNSTGDGQRMALELGAKILNGDMFHGGARFVAPAKPSWISKLPPSRWLMRLTNLALRYAPTSIVRRFVMGFLTSVLVPSHNLFGAGAILVNKVGERFADESRKTVFELAYQPDGIAYILLDGELAEKFSKAPHEISTAPGFAYAYLGDYEKNRLDLFHKGSTLEELARSMGIDSAKLAATVEKYNTSDADDAPAGPPARGQRPRLRSPPFYALGPVRNYINFTDGGLAVNERLQVLDAQDRAIPGLYAAGSAGQGGLLLKGHGHHLGWAFTSGRLAGKYVTNRAGV
ncbi:MAG: FAD-dependent oxidoreductase [Betaproteobacteria bacterium]|nr:FAD-dependent oxidoreductase [Betaproteobacteria bacterium]